MRWENKNVSRGFSQAKSGRNALDFPFQQMDETEKGLKVM